MKALWVCLLLSGCGEIDGPDVSPRMTERITVCGSYVESYDAHGVTYITIHVLPRCP